jgi:hypothetical protein
MRSTGAIPSAEAEARSPTGCHGMPTCWRGPVPMLQTRSRRSTGCSWVVRGGYGFSVWVGKGGHVGPSRSAHSSRSDRVEVYAQALQWVFYAQTFRELGSAGWQAAAHSHLPPQPASCLRFWGGMEGTEGGTVLAGRDRGRYGGRYLTRLAGRDGGRYRTRHILRVASVETPRKA